MHFISITVLLSLESPLPLWYLIMTETILANRNPAREVSQVLLPLNIRAFSYSTITATHIHLPKHVTITSVRAEN